MGNNDKEHGHAFDDNHRHSREARAAGPIGWVSQFLLFAKGFLQHPNMVGWVLPSSPFLVDEVLKEVDWERARVIVEYGPGVGAFTTRVLQRMRPDATLIATYPIAGAAQMSRNRRSRRIRGASR